jgi:hypothetical protein
MKIINTIFLLFSVMHYGESCARVVLSEIMFNPLGTERDNEFVEIYNTSLSDTVDLTGWLVGDGTKVGEIISHAEPLLIEPQQFAIILSPNYFENSNIYDEYIPPEALALSISSSQFGAYGLANDRGELVALYDSSFNIQSEWQYSVKNPDGFSEEKRVLQKGDFEFNWTNSTGAGGTPGFINSVTPLQYDLAIDTTFLKVGPQSPTRRDSLSISFWLKNFGTGTINSCRVDLFLGLPGDSQLLAQDFLQFPELEWLDSTFVNVQIPPQPIGPHQMALSIHPPYDDNEENNLYSFSVMINPSFGDIVIAELFLLPADGGYKWIEIVNSSGGEIDLINWSIKINDKGNLLSAQELKLEQDERVVLSESLEIENIFWETNSRIVEFDFPMATDQLEKIILLNQENVKIDSVDILFSDLNEDFSVERGAGENWGICPHPQGATLGEANALGRDYTDLGICLDSIKVSVHNARSDLDINLTACVSNLGTTIINNFTIQLYESQSDSLVQSLTVNGPLFPLESKAIQLELNVNQPDIYSYDLKMITENDAYSNNNEYAFDVPVGFSKNALLINEIMYNTDERDEEWIELFNPGNSNINLKNWTIGDAKKSVPIVEEDFWMAPFSFVFLGHQEISNPAQSFVLKLPEFNNSTDQVVLKDFTGNTIDSLKYSNSWGGERSISLERIRFEGPSVVPENWATCIDSLGHTAGTQNSVSPKSYDMSINSESIQFFPNNPSQGENVEISFNVENSGREALTGGIAKLYVKRSFSQEEFTLVDSLHFSAMNPNESKFLSLVWHNIPGGVYTVLIAVENVLDLSPANNTAEIEITIGYPEGTVLINEIMYNPLPEREDWVEIYNNGPEPVELASWRISNSDTSAVIILSDKSLMVGPKQFFVFSKDTILVKELGPNSSRGVKKLPNFKVGGDDVFLYDGIGKIIDHFEYSSDWGDLKGRSLERINPFVSSKEPSNWAQNVSGKGHSAGGKNSIYTRVLPSAVALDIGPNPFSPDGDGYDDLAGITISLPTTYANINVKIFDMLGRMVRFLANNEFSGAERTIFWDGKNDEGRDCRIGIYIVYLQALDESFKAIIEERKTVVLAKPL